MGKNKRQQYTAFDEVHQIEIYVDSIEEQDFIQWLNEAYKLKIIEDFEYQPESFILVGSTDYVSVEGKNKCLFRQHIYTADFKLFFNPKNNKELSKEFKVNLEKYKSDICHVYIDVKGTFARNDGQRVFSLNQKWVYQKYGIYVCKVIPKLFFQKFGVPESCLTTKKTNKIRKMYQGYKTIKDSFK